MIRLLVKDDLSGGATIEPTEDQARYLLTVMRLKVGERLLVFNGRHGEWRAAMASASKRSCTLLLELQTRPQAGSADFELIIAMVKRARLETIVEKAVELGVARIRLLLTQRTNSDRANLPRLSAIAAEAAEQTGRLETPDIDPPQKLEAIMGAWPSHRTLIYCDEAGDDPGLPWGGAVGKAQSALGALSSRAADNGKRALSGSSEAWAAIIGPEGGFSPDERALLRSRPEVIPVSLGPRILRADTAAIAAIVLWQAALGDWRSP